MRFGSNPVNRRNSWSADGRLFVAVLGASVAVHVWVVAWPTAGGGSASFALAASSVFPERGLGRLPAPHVSPEPMRPLAWLVTEWLAPDVRLRASVPLDPGVVDRFAEVYRRTVTLFPAVVGQAPRPVGPLDLRLVDLDLLNDPTCFDLEVPGRIHGLYFSEANVAYLTPTAAGDVSHLVHELGHFLYDEYGIDEGEVDEEARVEELELYVRTFERLLEHRHGHRAAPPLISADLDWPVSRRIPASVWLQALLAYDETLEPSTSPGAR